MNLSKGTEQKGTDMKFDSNSQFIEDAANEMVKAHLGWSNSLECNPSDGHSREVMSDMINAYMEGMFGYDWREVISREEYDGGHSTVLDLYDEACKLADSKWQQMLAIIGDGGMTATYDDAVNALRKSRETMERERDYYETARAYEERFEGAAIASLSAAHDAYIGNVSMVCDLFGVEYRQVIRDVKGE